MTDDTINKPKEQKEKILVTKEQYQEYIKNFYRSNKKQKNIPVEKYSRYKTLIHENINVKYNCKIFTK